MDYPRMVDRTKDPLSEGHTPEEWAKALDDIEKDICPQCGAKQECGFDVTPTHIRCREMGCNWDHSRLNLIMLLRERDQERAEAFFEALIAGFAPDTEVQDFVRKTAKEHKFLSGNGGFSV